MLYPSHAEYDLAVRYLSRFVFDSTLKAGTPRSRNGIAVAKGGEPLSYPGGFAKVYVVDCQAKTYALRVWLHEIADAAKRYQVISQFLKQNQLPCFVEHFEFVANGVLVGGKRYPLLRMEWVEGYSLREFIKQHLSKPALLQSAAVSFAAMVKELHARRVVHGDLQSENMLVRTSAGAVHYKLIDYDTLVVPLLLGQSTASPGLATYQHPKRGDSLTATEKDDYFSELVIYLCLRAVAEDSRLWNEFPACGRDKELLFEAADFIAPSPSPLFRRLHQLGGVVGQLAVILWNFTRCPHIRLLLPLEDVIQLASKPFAASGSTTSAGAKRSAFEELLKRKLSETQTRSNSLPGSWNDDSAFQLKEDDPSSAESRTKRARRNAPQTFSKKDTHQSQSTRNTQASSNSPKNTDSFQETFARMHNTSASASTTPRANVGLPSKPSDSASGRWVVIILAASIWAVSHFANNSGTNRDSQPRTTPWPTSTPTSAQSTERRLPFGKKPTIAPFFQTPIPKPTAPPTPTPTPTSTPAPTPDAKIAVQRNKAAQTFADGLELGKQAKYQEAIAAFREVLDSEPKNAGAWYNTGWAYAKLGDIDTAIPFYKRASELQPTNTDTWQSLVLGYAYLKDPDNASDAIAHLKQLDINQAEKVIRMLDVGFVQKIAVVEFPSLGVANSTFHREFISRYERITNSNVTFLTHSDWPLVLAQEVALSLKIGKAPQKQPKLVKQSQYTPQELVNLGYMYREGKGVPTDTMKAFLYFRQAAEQGNAEAQYNLGYMYRDGVGVAIDKTRAIEWYKKAASQGHTAAKDIIRSMK
jgi:TPR repeat protein